MLTKKLLCPSKPAAFINYIKYTRVSDCTLINLNSNNEIKAHTLYCLVLSVMVCPSLGCVDVEQGDFPVGHRHCFSIQGVPYVSTLLQTLLGLQTGKSESAVWKKIKALSISFLRNLITKVCSSYYGQVIDSPFALK